MTNKLIPLLNNTFTRVLEKLVLTLIFMIKVINYSILIKQQFSNIRSLKLFK